MVCVIAERIELLCEQLMNMRRAPRRSEDAESELSKAKGKKAAGEKRQLARTKAGSKSGRAGPRSRPMHSDSNERQVRQVRPGSAQVFLAVRKQAQLRRQGAGGNW